MTDDGAGTHPQGPAGPGPRPPYPTRAAYDPESIPGPRPSGPPPPPPPWRAGTNSNPTPPPTAPPRPWRAA